jgi:hypothetical protein
MELQHYNSQDLEVRTAIASCSIACTAAGLAKKWRYGSLTTCEEKQLEIVVAQLNYLRCGFTILLLPATTTITVLSDGATDVASHVTIDGVTVSDTFLYGVDNNSTADSIADAINNYTTLPDYTATVKGDIVTVTAVLGGSAINTTAVAIVGGDVVAATQFMNGGQNGVLEEDNVLTETEVEYIFNNIAKFTGCCYAPLGYGYESAQGDSLGITIRLNTGADLLLNTGDPVRLNKQLLTP